MQLHERVAAHVEEKLERTAVFVLGLQLADVSAVWQRDVPVSSTRAAAGQWVTTKASGCGSRWVLELKLRSVSVDRLSRHPTVTWDSIGDSPGEVS